MLLVYFFCLHPHTKEVNECFFPETVSLSAMKNLNTEEISIHPFFYHFIHIGFARGLEPNPATVLQRRSRVHPGQVSLSQC